MKKRTNVEKFADVITSASALHTKYKAYEAQYVHRAHDELYSLLASILVYVKQTLESTDAKAAIWAVRQQLKSEYNITTTQKTDNVGVLLRLVLRGAHRKTLHTYGRVIKQALNNGICSASLADYIKENGGIEKLRVGTIEAQQQAEYNKRQQRGNLHMSRFAVDLLNETSKKALATFEIEEKFSSRMHDTANRCEFRYMVCTYSEGKYNVVDMVPMDKELEAQLLARIANRKAELEYFMSDDELQIFEQVKRDYAAKAGIKEKPSKYAAKLKAANDDKTDKNKLAEAA